METELTEQMLRDIQPIFDKIKIGILGKSETGKSLLVYRFINREEPAEHETTIEDRYTTTELIEGINTTIEILDTAGDEEYQNLLDMWINYAEGFALIFSIDNKESFNAIKHKYDRIIKLKGFNCPLILLGNKKDLEKNRQVDFQEAKQLANSMGCEYVEISALNNENCRDPFLKIALKIIEQNRQKQKVLEARKPLPVKEKGPLNKIIGKCCNNIPCTIF